MKETLCFAPVETDAQIADLAALANTIWHECFAGLLTLAQIDYMVDKFQSRPAMTRQIRAEGYAYFMVQAPAENGACSTVGYLGLQPKDGKLLLSKLYLLAAARGRGYAGQIMAFVEQQGRSHGCTAVWLTVNRHNQRAIAAYRKTGFTQIREQVQDIGGGFVMDDYVFEKPL